MPGASRASPAARVRIAARSSSGAVSLSRNPLAPAPQRAVDVVVEVEGVQDEDPGCGSVRVGGDGAGGLDAVEDRHPDVHQDDVGVVLADHGDGLRAVRGLAQYLHVGRRADHDHEAAAYQCLVAASDDGGGQDRAGHEADDDQRGPAGGDGGDGVQGHDDIDDSPSSCPQVQGRQRDGEDERSVARGNRRRNGVATAATAYVTQPPASHVVPDARGARCGMRNPKATAISATVTTSMATSRALVKRWAARRRSRAHLPGALILHSTSRSGLEHYRRGRAVHYQGRRAYAGPGHVWKDRRGLHFCLGAHLARAQLRGLFSRLAERVRTIEAGEPDYLISNFVDGIKRMPVTVTPALAERGVMPRRR